MRRAAFASAMRTRTETRARGRAHCFDVDRVRRRWDVRVERVGDPHLDSRTNDARSLRARPLTAAAMGADAAVSAIAHHADGIPRRGPGALTVRSAMECSWSHSRMSMHTPPFHTPVSMKSPGIRSLCNQREPINERTAPRALLQESYTEALRTHMDDLQHLNEIHESVGTDHRDHVLRLFPPKNTHSSLTRRTKEEVSELQNEELECHPNLPARAMSGRCHLSSLKALLAEYGKADDAIRRRLFHEPARLGNGERAAHDFGGLVLAAVVGHWKTRSGQ